MMHVFFLWNHVCHSCILWTSTIKPKRHVSNASFIILARYACSQGMEVGSITAAEEQTNLGFYLCLVMDIC